MLIVITSAVVGYDLKCEVIKEPWYLVGEIEFCNAKSVNIRSMNEEITSVNGRTEPTSLQGLWISDQTVNYLPKGIDKFFPDLKGLGVQSSKLKSLTQDDLKSLPQLVYANFLNNDLESLDGDMFKFNPKLRNIHFSMNKIKYVGENLLNLLKDLQFIRFASNICININAETSPEIPALIRKLKTQCKFPQDRVLIKEIEQLKEEIADMNKNNSQKIIEMNSERSALEAENTRRAEILQDDNTKLKRWLKSCDGNLNAATEILFKTSDRHHVFTQLLSKSLDLIVQVDGSKVSAIKLIISSPGSKIISVNYAEESDFNIEATELYIDHQQTLFLPTNLDQHFPSLQVLAVTSSGLMQVDSSVFNQMKNLKVLNLNNNKLQEIAPGTFGQLKLLESLDLSSNNLKTLKTSVFTRLEKLQVLNLAANRLKTISFDILEPLKDLQNADLSNNDCVNLSYPTATLKEIEDQLIEECTALVEVEIEENFTWTKFPSYFFVFLALLVFVVLSVMTIKWSSAKTLYSRFQSANYYNKQ